MVLSSIFVGDLGLLCKRVGLLQLVRNSKKQETEMR